LTFKCDNNDSLIGPHCKADLANITDPFLVRWTSFYHSTDGQSSRFCSSLLQTLAAVFCWYKNSS